jgi:uncharacterized SAM-binding protein YcdF (DUF218 family)
MSVALRPRQRLAASVALVLLVLAGSASWLYRVPLLQGAATVWIVSDDVGPADAVAVLGGGLEQRPFAAADYYRRGLVPKVLLAPARTSPSAKLGISPSHVALNHAVLTKLGVPETAIETFGHELSSTFEESMALREWAERNHAMRIIVPTEVFSSRRVKWMLERALARTGTEVRVPALESDEYRGDEWWRKEQGLIAFQNEFVKYLYYRLKYGAYGRRQTDLSGNLPCLPTAAETSRCRSAYDKSVTAKT